MLTEKNSWQHFLTKMTAFTSKGWVLTLDLSKLGEAVSEQKRKLLNELLNELHKNKTLTFFDSDNPNFIFLYFPQTGQDDIRALLIKIQFLLGLSFHIDSDEASSFYTIYHLSDDWKKLKETFSDKVIQENVKIEKKQITKPSCTFSPSLLGKIEKNLYQADISSLMRHQSVCAIVGSGRPVELFEETYVSLSDLKKALCPNVDISESPWLLDNLFEVLDKRVLESLSHHDSDGFRKNFSINIAVNTLLTPEFEKFSKSVDDNLKSSILLELKLSDIFNNTSVFMVAKSYALSEGYRLCVDGLTADLLPFVNREKLQASFVKLQWDESLLKRTDDEMFINALKKNNPQNVILCHVDDARALKWGQDLGIKIYQGYYIQKLLYQFPRQ